MMTTHDDDDPTGPATNGTTAATDETVQTLRRFALTDEERDNGAFQQYLRTLTPEALWDIGAHLDRDRFPRRGETVAREMARRRLIYVSPYTAFEARLRGIFGWSVTLAALAAALRAVAGGLFLIACNSVVRMFGWGGYKINLEPVEHFSWFIDLAVGGPKAARIALPLALLLATGGLVLTLGGVCVCVWRLRGRRVRPDVLITGVCALVVIGVLTRLAFLPL